MKKHPLIFLFASLCLAAVPVVAEASIKQVSTGFANSCAIDSSFSNQLYCWGDNSHGQIGDGTTTNRATATAVPGMTGVSSVSVAHDGYNVCATRIVPDPALPGFSMTELDCWGDNSRGQLGDGTVTERHVPTAVVAANGLVFSHAHLNDIGSPSAAGDHTCVGETNSVYCWGANDVGQLGDSTATDRHVPTKPAVTNGGLYYLDIQAAGRSTCVRKYTSTGNYAEAIYCWGANDQHQLGNSASDAPQYEEGAPTIWDGFNSAGSIGGWPFTLGTDHGCAIIGTYSLVNNSGKNYGYCWGSNAHGQLGVGSIYAYSAQPLLMVNPPAGAIVYDLNPTSISAGALHTCLQSKWRQVTRNIHGQFITNWYGADGEYCFGDRTNGATVDGGYACAFHTSCAITVPQLVSGTGGTSNGVTVTFGTTYGLSCGAYSTYTLGLGTDTFPWGAGSNGSNQLAPVVPAAMERNFVATSIGQQGWF